jgi:cysteine desulfurase/selenocysteine lyase
VKTPVPKINFHELFAGTECEIPLLNGQRRPYVNLDNAATTSPLQAVVDHVAGCADWYSSVHRGAGFKSLFSTHAHHRCRERVARFVGADPDYHAVIFCGNTTDAINRLCNSFSSQKKPLILTTVMEHHSNMLPWRYRGRVEHVKVKLPNGELDLEHLEEQLIRHHGEVCLVAVTGASNITGLIPPLKQIARMSHEHGALLLVDAAQLIAHRPIEMGRADDPERIDFLAFSGHKMYAPFGSGALVAPRDFFTDGPPGLMGGGAVDLVTLNDVLWAPLPDKEEAGTPNLIGICAMAKAMDVLA